MSACPTPLQLEQFLAGELADPLAGIVGAHLDECAACDGVARRLAGVGAVCSPEGPPDVPGYRLIRPLGAGGMGVVWEAEQKALGRRVALKLIRGSGLGRPDLAARFDAEARALAKLSHPNVVTIYDSGVAPNGPYLAMEYLPGGSLQGRLASAALSLPETVRLVATLARAIHAAHCVGVIHRDLKPANVLFSATDEPKVVDFGIAKFLDRERELTGTGQVVGSAGYLAPEQAAGRLAVIGPATDVHGLGLLLYRLLAGRLPYEGGSSFEMLAQVIHQPPPPPSHFRPGLPPRLEQVCLRCLAKDPADRFASAADLAEALETSFDQGPPTTAISPARASIAGPALTIHLPHGRRATGGRVVLWGGLAGALLFVGWLAYLRYHPAAQGPEPPDQALAPLRRLVLGEPQLLIPRLRKPEEGLRCLAWSPKGRLLFAGGWHEEGLCWGPELGTTPRRWEQQGEDDKPGNTMAATFCPDGRYLITVGEFGAVREVSSGKIIGRLTGGQDSLRSVAALRGEALPTSADDVLVLAADHKGFVTGWSMRSRQVVLTLDAGGPWQGHTWVAASASAQTLITARRRPSDKECLEQKLPIPNDVLRIWRFGPGAPRQPLHRMAVPREWGILIAMALHSSGQDLYVAFVQEQTCRIVSWDLTVTPPRQRWITALEERPEGLGGVAVSPDGRWLASTCYGNPTGDTLHLWRASDGTRLASIVADQRSSIYAVAIAPDGQRLATVSAEGQVTLWPVRAE